MMLRPVLHGVAFLLALVALGCGTSPTQTPVRPPRPVSPAQPPQAVAPLPAPPQEAGFRQELNNYLSTLGTEAPSFETRYTSDERHKGETRKSVYTMRFQQKPRISLLEVIESTQIPKGFKVRDTGGDKVKVRLPGAVSFISIEVPARSSQSRSLMGLYPSDITPEKFIEVLMDPNSQVREVQGRVIDGRPLRMIEAVGPRTMVRGATLTIGLGENPRFAYHLAITKPDGSSLVQTFSRFKPRKFNSSELSL